MRKAFAPSCETCQNKGIGSDCADRLSSYTNGLETTIEGCVVSSEGSVSCPGGEPVESGHICRIEFIMPLLHLVDVSPSELGTRQHLPLSQPELIGKVNEQGELVISSSQLQS